MTTRELDDAAHMRALAHPTRLRIVGLLRTGGPQTAAMLGDEIDEAPGTISYHCRRLAEAGFIEPAPELGADRRERWWRATDDRTSWALADTFDDPERMLAATALGQTVAQAYAAEYERFLVQAPALGRDWVTASTSSDEVLRLTPDELAALGVELRTVLDRWVPVSDAHASGDGSERIMAVTQSYRLVGR
ncbi:ArsR/SmtB family transcription factor [Curtobacterium oceanosedimentum]|uniref:ArsR/SmtB family transcription factor n=1 Tax=Curtobacterium oceanosedimentum TaxID=465820 RepID=UPI001CE1B513|nr:transcriptional regulator [Curtobacterium oceanosedimentum]MCA5923339.1 helix-turn-helix domain-containing protein [Curtobacterium oceanosedimentum]